MTYSLPPLPYSYDSLEPYIDAQTMEIHHSKHHQAYITNLNAVLAKYPQIADRKLEELMENLSQQPFSEADKTFFKNNGGGHLNHRFFWQIMGKEKQTDEKLTEEIKKKFGSLEEFKKLFSQTAVSQFGSGWAWLVRNKQGNLDVYSTANQDSPHLQGDIPLIGLDVWEHAYYLKYQNRRNEYVENWWHILKLLP
ncbi:superoxide dismutase [Candidatus Gottesmanbacteria bacterium RIFCSPLOWO2_02_FULL_42_29]|uniref:Superoxide dismutase n=1 Tax=Candidatus Gottesmanbacteria bacterium RIFCSPLOWO2_01_FULL_42_22 TaxID=1798391 RepID=A0A1F6B9D5_9BACT|nr:MAG: Superoxide dismutase [Candidatus Gottesmanbacteria bacterium GW2011_GWC2_42_8]OGG10254.1 MAG: superoxide dismutase [Candidatus Gottesmanbacteria bacterium RIFCSPHIGHO2_01_FULL_42_27]OGG20285.1 MAG: superoxide dismutase [Candidatus Gottesmanbacteria bacterium RIFCSPHIGHO2_12_FULL_43_26]OGG33423.1 MAG: superoxide dismutase [Candidatus Gottesmanbacteria bacterium RIFCSPLOWO2_01_FULL_42_22]OGG39141.1 MAG: superoxide dismutase [Candidatus Gottesmanbacteria bacterium RIFCSPLOWO2_02_FULL_42_29